MATATAAGQQLSNAEIAEALKRAREVSSKLSTTNSTDSIKRPFADSDSYNGNPPKRLNNHDMSAGNPITALGNAPFNAVSGMEPIVIEQFQVPDNCVGLIIGRGGESITNIQNETGCRIQMSQSYTDASGKQMRGCTLTGTKSAIDKAKRALEGIIEKAGGTLPPSKPSGGGGGVLSSPNSGMPPGGGMNFVGGSGGKMITVEMQIPGTKCGLIIGKGGETIKQLQERANVKMVMIQENNQVTAGYKPLRIIGEPDKVEHAKRLIEDVMNSKDDKPPNMSFLNEYGSISIKPGSSMGEVIVPRSAVGVIIGKNGETIKKLTIESGAKIQFKQDYNAPERTALIVGSADQIQKATAMITELVNRALANDNSQGGPGGGGGVGGGSLGGGGGGGFMSRMGGQNSDAADVFYMHVPANKTGLVIGKGGETIKQISAESGARVELSREPAPSDSEKVFVVKGTPYQIHHAQHLIRIKVGDIPQGTPVPPFTGSIAAVANEQQQQQQFNYSNFNQPAAAAPTSADPNAAWAAYYAQYYQPTAANHFGGAAYPNPASSVAAAPAAAPSAQPTNSTSSAPSINPQTGQPDYSAQWAEYYRSLGMHEQAAMIEQQARANQAAAAAAVGQPAQSVAAGATAQNFGAYGQQQPAGYGYGQSAPAASGYQYAPHQY